MCNSPRSGSYRYLHLRRSRFTIPSRSTHSLHKPFSPQNIFSVNYASLILSKLHYKFYVLLCTNSVFRNYEKLIKFTTFFGPGQTKSGEMRESRGKIFARSLKKGFINRRDLKAEIDDTGVNRIRKWVHDINMERLLYGKHHTLIPQLWKYDMLFNIFRCCPSSYHSCLYYF